MSTGSEIYRIIQTRCIQDSNLSEAEQLTHALDCRDAWSEQSREDAKIIAELQQQVERYKNQSRHDPQPTYVQLEDEVMRLEQQVKVLREALESYRRFKPFDWRFDHSGAMNATQLGEHDRYLQIRKQADAALAALAAEPQVDPTCSWTMNMDGYYDTSCGGAFETSNPEGLRANGFRFCLYCGKGIVEPQVEESRE